MLAILPRFKHRHFDFVTFLSKITPCVGVYGWACRFSNLRAYFEMADTENFLGSDSSEQLGDHESSQDVGISDNSSLQITVGDSAQDQEKISIADGRQLQVNNFVWFSS